MQPTYPILTPQAAGPNFELLRRHGWSLNTISGSYCVAWRGRDESVFHWRDGMWIRVDGRGGLQAA